MPLSEPRPIERAEWRACRQRSHAEDWAVACAEIRHKAREDPAWLHRLVILPELTFATREEPDPEEGR